MADVSILNGYNIKDETARNLIENLDVIVDQGSSGIWYYRKWASGIAECWGTYKYTPSNLQGLVTNWYYEYTSASNCPLPFTFTTLKVILCSVKSASGAAIIQPHTALPATNATGIQFLASFPSNIAREQTVSILCKGTWK